jgi:Zn-dependent membrane protease YugP
MDLLLILAVIIVPLIAQIGIKINYSKYSKVENGMHMKGEEVARKILDMNGLRNVRINMVGGTLSDYYDPRVKTVNLSPEIFAERSISSAAVAAHECGHAIQDKEAYSFLRFRSAMVPVVNLTSRICTILIFLGFILEFANLFYLGILLMSVGLLFQLITLPVEFNASARAKKQLNENGIITKKDKSGIEKVLRAAALTYVANFLAVALQILRLVLLSNRRN